MQYKKVKLIGKNLNDIIPLLKHYGFETSDKNFDLVIAHGGDGTMLTSEREFPGIPKLVMRDCGTAMQCDKHRYESILNDFVDGRLTLIELPKVYCIVDDRKICGINDIFIHNFERMNALRYQVRIDNILYANEVVGDGVGISSVHGSTAYYKSITHSIFRTGIGLSFSNSTEEVNHLVLPETSTVQIFIVRGPGLIIADNDRNTIKIAEKSTAILGESRENPALIYGLPEFMCPLCRLLRHPNKNPIAGVKFKVEI